MDLDSIEGLNEIRPSVYRAAMKLQSLQRLCHSENLHHLHHVVLHQCVNKVFLSLCFQWTLQEVTQTLNRMFKGVSQEVPGHMTAEAPEETCDLMFRLYDRSESRSRFSVLKSLRAFQNKTLSLLSAALVTVSEAGSGSVSRSGLRCLLQDLSQVPAAVQEEAVFGSVEPAVRSCFNGVRTMTKEQVLSWLQSEPRLLLWLPTLYRLSVSQSISHMVRCHTCKSFPITGLRYRCMKCVKVHMCQSCFLTERQTRKHKTHHPVLEFCTQPTWRESLISLVHSARHTLLPRRHTQREADRRRVLIWAEPGETQNSAPPPPDASTQLADSAVCHSPSADRDVSHDASVQPLPPPCSSSSKALQTDEETPIQETSLGSRVTFVFVCLCVCLFVCLFVVRLLEQEMQAWRLTVQSEQGVLEDRCSEMEVTMETMRQHNLHLQGMLTQVTHLYSTEEEEELMKDEWSKDEQQTPSPTIHLGTPPSNDIHCEEDEEESADDGYLCRPIGEENGPEEAGLQREDTCLTEEEEEEEQEEEDCWLCSPEELLQETVDRLKTVMETDWWRERQTGETQQTGGERQTGETDR
uniref:ZZ-type domain-containing protein n=1 Tax=Lates calcarifer TaxID=8187 RepID=A0A4W6G0W2_LATCA